MKDDDDPGETPNRRDDDPSEGALKVIYIVGHALIIVTVLALITLAGVKEGMEAFVIALVLGALIAVALILAFRSASPSIARSKTSPSQRAMAFLDSYLSWQTTCDRGLRMLRD